MKTLNITEHTLSREELHSLDENGYVIVSQAAAGSWLDELRLTLERLMMEQGYVVGRDAGELNAKIPYYEKQRGNKSKAINEVMNVLNEGAVFDEIYTHPALLAAVKHLLGNACKVSQVTAREVLPGHGVPEYAQGLETDSGAIVNCIWLLDDSNAGDESLVVVPGSHKNGAIASRPDASTDGVPLQAPAGSIVILDGKLWRKEPVNQSGRNKRSIYVHFIDRSQPQKLNQYDFIRLSTYKRISDTAKYLLDV